MPEDGITTAADGARQETPCMKIIRGKVFTAPRAGDSATIANMGGISTGTTANTASSGGPQEGRQ